MGQYKEKSKSRREVISQRLMKKIKKKSIWCKIKESPEEQEQQALWASKIQILYFRLVKVWLILNKSK